MIRIAMVFCLGLLGASIANAQSIKFDAPKNPAHFPTDPKVTTGEVYGSIFYKVGNVTTSPGQQENPLSQFRAFFRSLLGETRIGSITLTLEIWKGEERLVREPFLVLEWNEKSVLFSPNSTKNIKKGTEERTVVKWSNVTNATNKLTVKFGVYVADEMKLDLSTLQKIVSFERLVSTGVVDLTPKNKLIFDGIQGLLGDLLGVTESATDENARELAFIRHNAEGTPKILVATVSFNAIVDGSPKIVRVPVEVHFVTHPTRLNANFADKKFVVGDLKAGTFDSLVSDPDDDKSRKVVDVLRTSNEQVRTFLDDLYLKAKYDGAIPIASRCQAFYNYLGTMFTKRDQVGYFYTFLLAKAVEISASTNGASCITNTIKKELEAYGLPATLN